MFLYWENTVLACFFLSLYLIPLNRYLYFFIYSNLGWHWKQFKFQVNFHFYWSTWVHNIKNGRKPNLKKNKLFLTFCAAFYVINKRAIYKLYNIQINLSKWQAVSQSYKINKEKKKMKSKNPAVTWKQNKKNSPTSWINNILCVNILPIYISVWHLLSTWSDKKLW